MADCQRTYEEFRRQRLEENKKKMEDLKLMQLSQILKNSSPKPSSAKPAKPRTPKEAVLVEVRRSARVANAPSPNYKELAVDYVKGPRRSFKRRDFSNRVYASYEARLYATEKATELQSNLEPEFPSFVKPMLQSHVTGGFWLGLPRDFCKLNLPKHDDTITLVDESGEDFPTVYLSQKNGLSGGWRGFSMAHDLVDGDALVFQLVKATTFKVFIIRQSESNASSQIEGAPMDPPKDVSAKQTKRRKT